MDDVALGIVRQGTGNEHPQFERAILWGRRLMNRVAVSQLPQHEVPFLLDLRDHEAFFRTLADAKLQK